MTRQHPLLSFVPPGLRGRLAPPDRQLASMERTEAVVLAADVSGFTQLAMTLGDARGIEELTAILNDGFSRLIGAVDERGGEVLSFAGDALVAAWPAGPTSVAAAISAALDAQQDMHNADERIRMRIGIADGELRTWMLGGRRGRWFACHSGAAVSTAAQLQTSAPLGRVVVSARVAELAGDDLERVTTDGVIEVVSLRDPVERRASLAAGEGGDDDPAPLDDALMATLRSYLPGAVVARLGAGHGEFLAERRTITVAMVALPGLEQAEEVEAFQDVVATVQEHAYRNEGSVSIAVDEKGVQFLIAFGIPPFAHEDDADRAIATAVSLDRALGGGPAGDPGGHGIGVATGSAFCGPIGNDVRREYTVLGDVVNLAARLADAARDPRRTTVLCDLVAAEAAQARWDFGTPLSLRLKGKTELLTVVPPVMRVAAAGLDRSADAEAPMVGRSDELERILSIAREGASAGEGRLVIVEGEAGLGKSTLLAEVQARLADDRRKVAVGFADALERSTPFRAWASVFATVLGLGDVEQADASDELSRRVGAHAPLLALVLGVEIAETETTMALTGEQRVGASRALLRSILQAYLDEHGSLVVLFEDGHWFDSASWGVLADAVGLAGLTAVVTMRPLGVPGRDVAGPGAPEQAQLLARPETTRIALAPLDRDEVADLARRTLGVDEVEPALLDVLAASCEGNPFFTVELLGLLQRRGSVTTENGVAKLHASDSIEVPESIQAAITARIDHLSADQQLTLKVASVIGSPFDVSVLHQIHPTTPHRDRLDADLDALVDQQLVVAAEVGSRAFNHALTREVAYHLMMGDQRRDLHRSLAEHLEATGTGAGVGRHYPLLGHHWLQAGDNERAVHFLHLASGLSMANGMPLESVAHGVAAARVLGVDLETDPARLAELLPAELADIERLMAGRRPGDLAALPELIDEQKGMGIAIVMQTMPAAHQSLQSELFALMAIRNLATTLRFGAGMFAPGVYAMYSIVVRGLGLDGRVAYEFSELARTVDAETGGNLAAAVSFISAWFNYHWYHPVHEALPIALTGAEAGLAGADPLYGSFNLGAATTIAAVSGTSLDDVIEMGRHNVDRIAGQSATAAFHNQLEVQVAKALSGRTEGPTSLTDGWLDEAALAAICETQNYNQAGYYLIAKLLLAYLADDDAAVDFAASAEQLLPSFVGQFRQAELTTLAALARLRAAGRSSSEDQAGQLREQACAALAALDAWAADCPSNFAHQADLVRGELAAVDGDVAAAGRCFAQAEDCAAAGGFVQWAAMAQARWADALRPSDPGEAAIHDLAAADWYERWGATVPAAARRALASA